MDLHKREFPYPIVFCADGKFKNHVLVTAISIIENNKEFNFKFYLLCSERNSDWNTKATACMEAYGASFNEIEINESDFQHFPVMHHFSPANYFRLLIPEIIQEPFFIYLDADIICTDSLSPFLDLDLKGKVLAAVEDPVYIWKETLGMHPESGYFNSGVIFVDSIKWKKMTIGKRVMDFLSQYPEKIRFVDQCGLNAVLDGDWLPLAPKFNQQAILFRKDFSTAHTSWTEDDILIAKNEPLLIHFTGPSKPWQYSCPHPLKYWYWKYQQDSPFKLSHPMGMKWSDHIKKYFPKSLKHKLRRIIGALGYSI